MKFTPVLMYVCQFSDVVLHAVRFAVVVKWQAHRDMFKERRTSAFRLVCSAHSPVSVTSLIGSGSAASFDGVTDAIAESIIIIMLGDVSYCLKDRTTEQTYRCFHLKDPGRCFHRESYYKGQQTTPKPTCTNTHSLLSGREPAGPLHATPYPHCGGLA